MMFTLIFNKETPDRILIPLTGKRIPRPFIVSIVDILDIDPMGGKINSDLLVGITESFSSVALDISCPVDAIRAVEGFE